MTMSLFPGRRRLALVYALVALAVVMAAMGMAAASARAWTWTDDHDMASETDLARRATFVADPGQGGLWAREGLISGYEDFYRSRNFANVLFWAPERTVTVNPAARWAGCGPDIPTYGTCPGGVQPLHLHRIDFALQDTTIRAFAWGDAFLSRVCGNFSEATAQPMPTIAGTKYEDVDGDGERDAGEPGLAGWTIKLFQGGTELASTLTDGNGEYRFRLDAQNLRIHGEDFRVEEVPQPGWAPSVAPGPIHVPFGSGDGTFGGNDFGNYRPAAISGLKYEDMDADGGRDAGDPRLAGWTVRLGSGPSAPRTEVTGSDGAYAFHGLRPGTYTVAEDLQDGWRHSSPADGTFTITVRSGEAATAEFGNYRPATIAGMKFDDHDVNRLADVGDGGLADWTISLSGGRSPDASQVTDADGRYSFGGLVPGTYVVGEALKGGWRQSAPASGTHTVTVRSGDTVAADFGNVCLGRARVLVTDQVSGAPLGGVEVRIEERSVPGELANEPPLPRTTIGTPTFADLLPGSYRVVVFLPPQVYTTDPDLRVVGGRLAVVKDIVVGECATTDVPIKMITASAGKVTGGTNLEIPGGFATAGYVFMTRDTAVKGVLEYQDHVTGLNLHTDLIEQVFVTPTDAWIGGQVMIDGVMHRFELHLVDVAEPGTEDRFELLIDNGYSAGYGETLDGGNVQIH